MKFKFLRYRPSAVCTCVCLRTCLCSCVRLCELSSCKMSNNSSLCKHMAGAAGLTIDSILPCLHKNQIGINVILVTLCSVTPDETRPDLTGSDPGRAERCFRGSEGECRWDSRVGGIAGMRSVCLHTQRPTPGAARRGRPSRGQHKRTSRGGPAPSPRNGLATSTTLTVIPKRAGWRWEDGEGHKGEGGGSTPPSKRRKMPTNAEPRTDRKDNGPSDCLK